MARAGTTERRGKNLDSVRLRSRLVFLTPLLLGASTLGCAGHDATIDEIMNHQHCRTLTAGVHRVAEFQLPNIRGVTLLEPPSAQVSGKKPERSNNDSGASTPLLVATSKGPQPTPGYQLTLMGAAQSGGRVTIQYTWETPAADAVLATVLTSPCSIVSLQGDSPIQSVDVYLNETLHGSIEL